MAIKRRSILVGGAGLVAAGWVSAPAIVRAQSSSKVNVSHGFAMHGMPKYAADAGPPDWLNPGAPKGGSVRLGARGSGGSGLRRHRRGGQDHLRPPPRRLEPHSAAHLLALPGDVGLGLEPGDPNLSEVGEVAGERCGVAALRPQLGR